MGGEQPITGSVVQLYAVGTSTDGGASTALINQTLTPVTTSDGSGMMNSNANAGNNNNQMGAGYFTISGDYVCPSASTLVYLATIGGNPGVGVNNAQEQLAALGECGNLSPNTYITINEVTTIGTVRALSSYMTGYASVGSTTNDAAALATAFDTANEYVNIANGTAPGPTLPSGYDAAANDLRALANVVQNCVNSDGSTNNGSNCGTFFAAAQGTASTVPTDTVGALLDIFADPTDTVTAVFNLQGLYPAFEPTNTTAPLDWTLPILPLPGTPQISPNGGSYNSVQAVSVIESDPTASIYYTTDGSTPDANSMPYLGGIPVNTSETVNVIAIESGRLSSPVTTATFTLSNLTPMVSMTSVVASQGDGSGQFVIAISNVPGTVVNFSTANFIGGTFIPGTCTITGSSCFVFYYPSTALPAASFPNDLVATFSATGSYAAATAYGNLTITPTLQQSDRRVPSPMLRKAKSSASAREAEASFTPPNAVK